MHFFKHFSKCLKKATLIPVHIYKLIVSIVSIVVTDVNRKLTLTNSYQRAVPGLIVWTVQPAVAIGVKSNNNQLFKNYFTYNLIEL